MERIFPETPEPDNHIQLARIGECLNTDIRMDDIHWTWVTHEADYEEGFKVFSLARKYTELDPLIIEECDGPGETIRYTYWHAPGGQIRRRLDWQGHWCYHTWRQGEWHMDSGDMDILFPTGG